MKNNIYDIYIYIYINFSGGASGKEPSCQCRRRKKCGFDPWVGKIPWRRAWQLTHSSILVWRIPWTEAPGGLQSMGPQSWTWLKWLSIHINLYFFFTEMLNFLMCLLHICVSSSVNFLYVFFGHFFFSLFFFWIFMLNISFCIYILMFIIAF